MRYPLRWVFLRSTYRRYKAIVDMYYNWEHQKLQPLELVIQFAREDLKKENPNARTW